MPTKKDVKLYFAGTVKIKLMQKFIFSLIFLLQITLAGVCQGPTHDFERVRMGNAKHILCGLDISPDGQYLAISSVQSFPFYIFDWQGRTVKQEFSVGNWYAGSYIRYSADGRYIILQKLLYADWAQNKDKEVTFEIIEAATGKVVKRFDSYHALTISPDSKYAISLSGEEVAFWDLSSGSKEKSFKVNSATNGVAISPDGRKVAVSHRALEIDLENNPRFKKDKKALKNVVKYKQQVSVYNAETFEKEYTVDEFYDIIYRLKYSPDGKTLFCVQIPHLKSDAKGNKRQTFISTINGETGEPLRKGFTSQSNYEPDFKLSHNGKLFGLVSLGEKFPEIHIYDFETGRMLHRFELSVRMFEKKDGEWVANTDGRSSFVFLPDDKTVVFTMGNHLIYWKIEN
ncbi:MAG: hypothetical protein R2750_11545 [Bacteroidales bacterium]